MRKLRYLCSWVMAFFTCFLALSGCTLAADYFDFAVSDDDASTYGLIVDKSCWISWESMVWSSSFGSGSLASGASSLPATSSGGYQHFFLDRQIDLPVGHGSGIVNVSPGVVKLSDERWNAGITSVKGQIRFGLIFRDNGNDPVGASYYIAPQRLKLEINVDGTNQTIESEGSIINVDLSFPDESEIRGMNLYAYFGDNQSVQIETFKGAMFLWTLMSSTVRAYKGDANAQYQDNVVSGINEGNSLLAGIWDGISDLWDAVTALPSKIADAIKGLFVPTDAQMEELKESFNGLLSEKLGFVYQSVSLADGVFDAVFDAVDNPDSDVSFTVPAFPAFAVGGVDVSLWEQPIDVDISENEVVQTVQTVASPFVVAVMVWGFVHSMEDAFFAFVGGQSLADWVRNRKGEHA